MVYVLNEGFQKKIMKSLADKYDKTEEARDKANFKLKYEYDKAVRNKKLGNGDVNMPARSQAVDDLVQATRDHNDSFDKIRKYKRFYPVHGQTTKDLVDAVSKREKDPGFDQTRIEENRAAKAKMLKDFGGPTHTRDLGKKKPGEVLAKAEEKKKYVDPWKHNIIMGDGLPKKID